MKKVTVVFRAEQRGAASDALRLLGTLVNGSGGYVFDDVEYSDDMKMTKLTAEHVTVHVPTRNILLVHVFENGEQS